MKFARMHLAVSAAFLVACLPPAVRAADSQIKNGKWFGCQHKETIVRINSMLAAHDKVAASKVLSAAYDIGECMDLKSGASVIIQEASKGFLRIRARGDTGELWTFDEAVTD